MSPNTADATQRAVIITRSIHNAQPSNVKISTQGSIGQFDDLQKEMKNFEAFSKEYGQKEPPTILEEYKAVVEGSPSRMHERMSGYPNPKLYDQFYINKYSFPKGLACVRKEDIEKYNNKQSGKSKQSLYDLK